MFRTLFSVPGHILIAQMIALSALVPVFKASAEPVCDAQAPVITSEFLVNLALECSPSQRAIAARWQAQQHRVDVAGRLDDPKLMVSAAPQTFDNDQLDDGYIAEIQQSIPWPGTLSLEKQAASAEADAWQARVGEHQVALARKIRLAFAEWQYNRQLLKINQEHQQLWKEFLAVVEAKYAAGTATRSTLLQATHEAHLLMEETIELKGKIRRDASTVKELVGLPQSTPLASQPIEPIGPVTLPGNAFDNMLLAIERQPGMQRLKAERAGTAAELALAKKERYPDFSVGARYNSLWMNEDQRWTVGIGMNIPLDFGKRSSQEASVRAKQDALRWEQSDLVNELREQLIRTHSVWIEGKEIYELYQEKLLPLSEEHLTVALQAYQAGTDDFLSLLVAQRQTLKTQRKAELALRRQFVALADLTAAAGLVWLDDWQVLGTAQSSTYSND